MRRERRWSQVLHRTQLVLAMGWQRLVCGVANLRRRFFLKRLPDYAVFVLNQGIVERPPAQPWWYSLIPGYQAPLTLAFLSEALRQIAADPDVKGVVFLFKGVDPGLARAQSLAALFARFRAWDQQFHPIGGSAPPKRIIVHLEQITKGTYVAASAADQIIVTPLTTWDVIGLYSAPTFLKDTLKQVGVAVDVVKIAPWKTAMDQLSEAAMSPAYAEQTQWLLDSLFNDITQAIQTGRRLSSDAVKAHIDSAPWTAPQAQAHGLVDTIAYEDELPELLGMPGKPAKLQLYNRIRWLLWRRIQRQHPQAVGVISLTGAIVPGASRSFPITLPLLGEETLGHLTAQQQIRAARKDSHLAAIIVHVDSRGGSALASDLIWRELTLLDQEKPVIIYMGDVAASGGYYIATPGRKIVAQRATLTGSIGVITAKPVLKDVYNKLQAHRYAIQHGTNADLYADDHPWLGVQRQKVEEGVVHVYDQFKQRVAAGRGLALDQLDALANGRVWTGAQAHNLGLIDAVGDFQVAMDLACNAANLPVDGAVQIRDLTPPKQRLLAEPGQIAKALLNATRTRSLQPLISVLLHHDSSDLLARERYWLIADNAPQV